MVMLCPRRFADPSCRFLVLISILIVFVVSPQAYAQIFVPDRYPELGIDTTESGQLTSSPIGIFQPITYGDAERDRAGGVNLNEAWFKTSGERRDSSCLPIPLPNLGIGLPIAGFTAKNPHLEAKVLTSDYQVVVDPYDPSRVVVIYEMSTYTKAFTDIIEKDMLACTNILSPFGSTNTERLDIEFRNLSSPIVSPFIPKIGFIWAFKRKSTFQKRYEPIGEPLFWADGIEVRLEYYNPPNLAAALTNELDNWKAHIRAKLREIREELSRSLIEGAALSVKNMLERGVGLMSDEDPWAQFNVNLNGALTGRFLADLNTQGGSVDHLSDPGLIALEIPQRSAINLTNTALGPIGDFGLEPIFPRFDFGSQVSNPLFQHVNYTDLEQQFAVQMDLMNRLGSLGPMNGLTTQSFTGDVFDMSDPSNPILFPSSTITASWFEAPNTPTFGLTLSDRPTYKPGTNRVRSHATVSATVPLEIQALGSTEVVVYEMTIPVVIDFYPEWLNQFDGTAMPKRFFESIRARFDLIESQVMGHHSKLSEAPSKLVAESTAGPVILAHIAQLSTAHTEADRVNFGIHQNQRQVVEASTEGLIYLGGVEKVVNWNYGVPHPLEVRPFDAYGDQSLHARGVNFTLQIPQDDPVGGIAAIRTDIPSIDTGIMKVTTGPGTGRSRMLMHYGTGIVQGGLISASHPQPQEVAIYEDLTAAVSSQGGEAPSDGRLNLLRRSATETYVAMGQGQEAFNRTSAFESWCIRTLNIGPGLGGELTAFESVSKFPSKVPLFDTLGNGTPIVRTELWAYVNQDPNECNLIGNTGKQTEVSTQMVVIRD